MATLGKVAQILMDMYSGGRIKVTNVTLEKRDMLEYAKLGYANVMRNMWLSLNKGKTNDEYYFFTGMLQPVTFDIQGERNPRIVDMEKHPTIRMPQNNHLFEVMPVAEEDCIDGGGVIVMVAPGESKFYTSPDFSNQQFFEPRGNTLRLYNVPSCIKKVEVTALFDREDRDIPNDLAFDIIKSVLRDVFAVKEVDTVKIDDNSNKLIQQIKSQLGIVAPQ